ncbi:hypothetical protein PF005_g31714 [Phytophthora fragariae]|uniref:Uncharacterized protein n=1 Tax=Phytophthora fragariae TaxID=53985 RepID=A0A6A3VDZ5_9STRA|nr:hypothetical protein PF009_g31661 [Phytophthora fragariae]KAE8963017.1 hypothetical protein PF011_g29185 [Phytophthora fragariae]KAE9160266.1 hypothetical protein PF005_g31714 [Phytophthora fragariae]KAE9163767.1 hypothetical protein PF002_g31775 [Phytophthora fragariae]KAE9263880.1 hypothetical protein PF008_g32258 [Phytophthora fragariae]
MNCRVKLREGINASWNAVVECPAGKQARRALTMKGAEMDVDGRE